jgi:hypothetical protein
VHNASKKLLLKFFQCFDLFFDENQIKVFFLYAQISKNARYSKLFPTPLKVYYKGILMYLVKEKVFKNAIRFVLRLNIQNKTEHNCDFPLLKL